MASFGSMTIIANETGDRCEAEHGWFDDRCIASVVPDWDEKEFYKRVVHYMPFGFWQIEMINVPSMGGGDENFVMDHPRIFGNCLKTHYRYLTIFNKHKQNKDLPMQNNTFDLPETSLNHNTLEGLLEIRTLTGVTRISEHHLVNGLSSHAVNSSFFMKLTGVRADVFADGVLDAVQKDGFVTEMRPYDSGKMTDTALTLNAFLGEVINGKVIQTNLLHVTIRDGKSSIIHYYAKGHRDNLANLSSFLRPYISIEPVSTTYICGFGDNGPIVDSREINLEVNSAHASFYPQLKQYFKDTTDPLQALATEFDKNKANLLFLIGTPGTGKSTLIRYLCGALRHRPIVQFAGEKTIQNVAFDTYVATLPKNSLVVIEDADNIVGKRADGNHSMSMLLNEIDGVASKGIKFIISTNLATVRDVDEALLRPGRLAYSIEFRDLEVEELEEVAKDLDIKREITGPVSLANFISPAAEISVEKPKFGF